MTGFRPSHARGSARPTTAVVIVTTSSRRLHLERSLAALSNQAQPPEEVVVVEIDADARPMPGLVTQRVPVRAIGTELPLAHARNAGVAATTADRIVLLDADCIAHPDLVGDYGDALSDEPSAVACGRVRYLEPGWDASPPTTLSGLDVRSAPHPARPSPARSTLDHDHPELLWSLNMAVTRATWQRLGGFDDGFRGYGAEDTDLGLRARSLGIALLWVAGALAYHQWHEPTRLDPTRTADIVANARRFHRRWQRWPMEGWLRELAAAGAVRFDPSAGELEEVTG